MASATTQLAVPAGAAWVKVGDGPLDIVLKVDRLAPDVEVYYGPTGALADTVSGFPLQSWDGALSVNALDGDSLWVRCLKQATTVFVMAREEA